MDKILKALKKVLPAEQIDEVAKAVEEMVNESKSGIEAELEAKFTAKLDEAYEQLAEEKKQDEAIAAEGYQQAYQIIASLMTRIDEQREEFETALEEGFDEAYNELEKVKAKNKNIEVEVYEEFDNKLKEMKTIMVDKIDQFLSLQEAEMYESAKKDVLSDPRVLEQRVAVEKMAEILSDYMSNDEYSAVTSSKVEEAHKQIENLKGQLRIIESKNVNLSRLNNKLNEQVREAHNIITEATKNERKERTSKKENASGRGQRVVSEEIISEYAAPAKNNSNNGSDLKEGHDPLNDLLVLSGIIES
jgi:hypothetical protein